MCPGFYPALKKRCFVDGCVYALSGQQSIYSLLEQGIGLPDQVIHQCIVACVDPVCFRLPVLQEIDDRPWVVNFPFRDGVSIIPARNLITAIQEIEMIQRLIHLGLGKAEEIGKARVEHGENA